MARNDRVPPSDEARLDLFLAALAQYEDLTTALPLVESFDMIRGAKDASERWTTALHAMVLRKFYAEDDELHLVKVVDSVEAVAPPSPSTRANLNQAREAVRLQRKVGGPWTFTPKGGEPTSFALLAFDDLYGGLLHGDYGRWVRSSTSSVSDFVMWDWSASAAYLLRQIKATHDRLISGRTEPIT